MAMVFACASMEFSTNSAMALSGLLCERAMIRIAFQSSPIRNLPLSESVDLVMPIFATVTRNSMRSCNRGTTVSPSATHYTDGLTGRAAVRIRYTQDASDEHQK